VKSKTYVKTPISTDQKLSLGLFLDDVGLGTDSKEEHHKVLEVFILTCQQNSIRIELSKCEFIQESFEYLSYDLEWNAWSPSRSKIPAMLNTKFKPSGICTDLWARAILTVET